MYAQKISGFRGNNSRGGVAYLKAEKCNVCLPFWQYTHLKKKNKAIIVLFSLPYFNGAGLQVFHLPQAELMQPGRPAKPLLMKPLKQVPLKAAPGGKHQPAPPTMVTMLTEVNTLPGTYIQPASAYRNR